MKALYIGFSKTGTKTMHAVFKILGYKSYDFDDHAYYLSKEWHQLLDNGGTPEDFRKIFKGLDATSDIPVYHFWEQILEAFPDIKLLVHYRDEKSWHKSFMNHIKEVENDTKFKVLTMLSPTAQRFIALARHNMHICWGSERGAWPWQMLVSVNPVSILNIYRRHNVYVQQKAPKDQLHVVNFKDGWEPICKFLGEPIPDVPFPHSNIGGEIMREYMKTSPSFAAMKREMIISVSVIFLVLASLIGYVFHILFQ